MLAQVQVHCQLGPAAPAMHRPRHCRETIKTPAMQRSTQINMLLTMLLTITHASSSASALPAWRGSASRALAQALS
jgi:hypothetical protein